jgi:hypothetical protein
MEAPPKSNGERDILLFGGHPAGRHLGVQGALQHDSGQLRLGLEPDSSGTRAAQQRAGSSVQLRGSTAPGR